MRAVSPGFAWEMAALAYLVARPTMDTPSASGVGPRSIEGRERQERWFQPRRVSAHVPLAQVNEIDEILDFSDAFGR